VDGIERGGLNRRILLAGSLAACAAGCASASPDPLPNLVRDDFRYAGRPQQGGFLIGHAAPRAEILVDGKPVGRTSTHGLFVVGFDRDAPATARLAVIEGGREQARNLAVAPGVFDIQRIDGLPEDQVAPSDPALLARIAREAALKTAAFASLDDAEGFKNGFDWPVEATRRSSSFGGQRILNGHPGRPHYGVDLAAPVGAPIHAPAPGLVILAEPDLHFEGGLTLIDHGQGLIAMFLHQSRQMVRVGDRVQRGQLIGAVGQTGRATGPHLCWRLKWRDRNLDPSLLVGASA